MPSSFLGSAWLIGRMRFDEPHSTGRPPLRLRELVDFRPVLEGARYIRSEPRLFATVFVKAGIGLLGANNVLLPIFGERIFPVTMATADPQRAAMLGMSMLMGARWRGGRCWDLWPAAVGPVRGNRGCAAASSSASFWPPPGISGLAGPPR